MCRLRPRPLISLHCSAVGWRTCRTWWKRFLPRCQEGCWWWWRCGGWVLGVRLWQLVRWWSLFLFYFSRVSARLLCFSLCFELHRSACGRSSGAFAGCASIATCRGLSGVNKLGQSALVWVLLCLRSNDVWLWEVFRVFSVFVFNGGYARACDDVIRIHASFGLHLLDVWTCCHGE